MCDFTFLGASNVLGGMLRPLFALECDARLQPGAGEGP